MSAPTYRTYQEAERNASIWHKLCTKQRGISLNDEMCVYENEVTKGKKKTINICKLFSESNSMHKLLLMQSCAVLFCFVLNKLLDSRLLLCQTTSTIIYYSVKSTKSHSFSSNEKINHYFISYLLVNKTKKRMNEIRWLRKIDWCTRLRRRCWDEVLILTLGLV